MNKINEIWIDAIEFNHKGGWKEDTQFVHLMGSGYLIAANLPGQPVDDATTKVNIPQKANYRIWARTRNWLRPHNPGTFSLLVNGKDNGKVLGTMPSDSWVWEIVGDYQLEAGETTLTLHDLTGYFGRCAAILITDDLDFTPSREISRMQKERADILGIDISEKFGGDYDVIVAGGGPGGVPAALAAARKGVKTLLLQNRPVLGGNGSREIGITFEGASSHYPYAREGGIAEELRRLRDQQPEFTGDWTNALEKMTNGQENLTILYNQHVCDVIMENESVIKGVVAMDFKNFGKTRFTAKQFIDCTGDGWLGYYAGAKYRFGREAQYQHNEDLAPEAADTLTMSGCIRVDHMPFMFKNDVATEYKAPDWVPKLPEKKEEFGRSISLPGTRMAWWLEAPNTYDDLYDGEESRDALILVLLGYFHYVKNHWEHHEVAKYLQMKFSSITVGKRETRRFIGDYVLTQNDCVNGARFDDAVSYTGWNIDIHHPEGIYSGKKGGLYCAVAVDMPHVPYRCLYSVNIDNLFFAGRNISTTHIAMGTTRVQNTIATLGQTVGTAAAICIKLDETPRGIYQHYMKQLQQQLLKDDLYIPGFRNTDEGDPCLTATATASSYCTDEEFVVRRGMPGNLMPLDRDRIVSISLNRKMGTLNGFYIKLHSSLDQPKKVVVHAKKGGNNVDNAENENSNIYTAEVVVPPCGEHWIKVPISFPIEENKYIDTCICYVCVEAAEGISWRIINGLNMYYRYGEVLPNGTWKTLQGKSYYIQVQEPDERLADCSPKNVNNGYNRIVDADNYEWVSDPAQSLPQWVALDFEKETAINSVSVVFNTDLANPIVSWSDKNPTPPKLVKDYSVEVYDGEKWITVAKETDNIMRKRIHNFDTVVAQKIRVNVQATWGDASARIMEIRAALETK